MGPVPSTDGVSLALHDLGGSGRSVLLAHATGFHGRVWAPLAAALADGFHAWALDFRGHGDTPPPDHGGMAWDGFADDVLAVVDRMGLSRPVAVGHSKGSTAVLLAEERRPGTFAALYCYEPVIFPPGAVRPPGEGEQPLAANARRRREVFRSRAEAYENYAAKPPLSTLHPDALRAYVDHGFADLPDGTVRLKCRGEMEARVYEMGPRHRAYDGLPGVACPVTVAVGRDDGGGPARHGAEVAARLPAGRLERFDRLGHLGPLEDPAAVAAAVRRTFTG